MRFLLFIIVLLCLQQTLSQDECSQESAILNTNAGVAEATSNLQSEASGVLQRFTEFCSIIRRSCSANLATLDSAKDLNNTCVAQGGKLVERDVGLKCTGSISGIPIPGGFSVVTENFPACVGKSCDGDALPENVEAVFGTVLDGAEKEIESALGDGVNCTQASGAWSLGMTSTLAAFGVAITMLISL